MASHFAWMAWTWQTAAFFGAIALALVVMTALAILRPETPRVGVLGIATTRGDRLFVTLLGSAFIFILYLRLGGEDLLYPVALAVLFGAAMFRFA